MKTKELIETAARVVAGASILSLPFVRPLLAHAQEVQLTSIVQENNGLRVVASCSEPGQQNIFGEENFPVMSIDDSQIPATGPDANPAYVTRLTAPDGVSGLVVVAPGGIDHQVTVGRGLFYLLEKNYITPDGRSIPVILLKGGERYRVVVNPAILKYSGPEISDTVVAATEIITPICETQRAE